MNNMKNIIQELRDQLDLIEKDALLESEFLEELILEASPLINMFGRDAEGVALAKYLHKKYKVSNQARLVPYVSNSGNLDLMTFKTHYDNFMVLKGPNGWAAMKPKEEYLRRKLEKQPGYNPSNDINVPYIGIFSLKNGEDIEEKEIWSTRGGNYKRKEKAEVKNVVTIADQLKDRIGRTGITVYRLMDRDSDIKTLPPERLMGRRSADLSTSASVQRSKIDARAASKAEPGLEELINQLYRKFSRLKLKLIKQIKVRRIRAGDRENSTVQDWEENPDAAFSVSLKKAIKNAILHDDTVVNNTKSEIEQYRQKTGIKLSDETVMLKAALAGNPTILSAILKSIKNNLEAQSQRN